MILEQRIFFNRSTVFCLASVLLLVIGVVKKLKKKNHWRNLPTRCQRLKKKKVFKGIFFWWISVMLMIILFIRLSTDFSWKILITRVLHEKTQPFFLTSSNIHLEIKTNNLAKAFMVITFSHELSYLNPFESCPILSAHIILSEFYCLV